MLIPVIMAGGSGSRLWPLSRTMYPKQFLNIVGENTMLQDTLLRLAELESSDPIIICNNEHRFLVAEQLRDIDYAGEIILEPFGRNTAPAITLAALQALEKDKESTLLVLAADHVIQDTSGFCESIKSAISLAENNELVTFGIVPDKPETGFGYIKAGAKLSAGFKVDKFVEKPSYDVAKSYVDSGEYFWNSGMFLFKASVFLEELEKYNPEILDVCKKCIGNARKDLDFLRISQDDFESCPSDSIDYAVMEKTESAAIIPLDVGWNDIGSWSAMWDINAKDENNNKLIGDVIAEKSSNCFIRAEDRLVSVLGLDNVVVVDSKDALLVANKSMVQDVKTIVSRLKNMQRDEWKIHREVYRPWGKYDSIDVGTRYQVKRITVNPGAKLSVQMHHHRAEHWVVVSGTASVTNGDRTFLVSENESTYIPIGTIHALENPGKVPLELIEVQTGSYLGEDDIVRLEDNYGRA